MTIDVGYQVTGFTEADGRTVVCVAAGHHDLDLSYYDAIGHAAVDVRAGQTIPLIVRWRD